MVEIDALGNIKPTSIHLAKPSGEVLGNLDDEINESTVSLTLGVNQRYELDFETVAPQNSPYPSYDTTPSWYEYWLEGMYLFVPDIGLFKMTQPSISLDGLKDTYTVVAYSCDFELDDKVIQLSLNMGTEESQEFLVTYDEDETESLLNPYTGIPYDWLVLYNTFPEQLAIELDKYDNGYYGEPNDDGEIVVYDEDLIDELQTLFTRIPRLLNKVVEITDEDGFTDYEITEYVSYEYDAGEEVIGIILLPTYRDRILYLIDYYTKYRDQLSLLSIVLEKTDYNWTVGEVYGMSEGDYTLANKKYQFQTDENLYSFLTNTLAQTIECVVSFDIVRRKVNVTPVEDIGRNTGIAMSYDNLMNVVDVSCDEDSLCTRLYVYGADELSIEQVNFGLPYIDDLSYKINVRDSMGKRIYVTDELAEKYTEFVDFRESLRDEYVDCSRDYNSYDAEITELKYRVPNDSVQTDWNTFSLEELEAELLAYKNLMTALIALYINDYGNLGVNEDGSVDERYIRNTIYWYDYCAYKITITQIQCAIDTYPNYGDDTLWSDDNIEKYEEEIKAWETEWSLFGTIELQAKIETYKQNMDILIEGGAVIKVDEEDYITGYEIKTWNELTDEEKAEYMSLEINYYYDTYMEYYNNMVGAQEYLDELLEQISELEELQTATQERRLEIVDSVTFTNYFEPDEAKVLNRLLKESTYTNENILVTSLNNTVDSIDVMLELLEDGQEELSKLCRPQLKFAVDADNLLGLPDFEPLWQDFECGNYMMVQYHDNTYVKLRMVSYTYNPYLPSGSFTVNFSNFIRSKSEVSDIESMLGLASGMSSGGYSTGGGGGGTYGDIDDIDVTISNTMLSKLLTSETFSMRVTNIIYDTIDVNAITTRYASFGGLANGTTTIDGECIQTGVIISNNYYSETAYEDENGRTIYDLNNTEGSILKIDDGTFSFGGGKLKWDGTSLDVHGTIHAESGSTFGAWTISDDAIYIGSDEFQNADGMYFGTKGLSISDTFSVTAEGELTARGVIHAASGSTFGAWTISDEAIYRGSSEFQNADGMYFGEEGLSISDAFYVTPDGRLNATNSANIDGEITATKLTLKDSYAYFNFSGMDDESSTYLDLGYRQYKNDIIASELAFGENGINMIVAPWIAPDEDEPDAGRYGQPRSEIRLTDTFVYLESGDDLSAVALEGDITLNASEDFYIYSLLGKIYANQEITIESDARLKTDITRIDEYKEYDKFFDSLSPVSYRYKSGGGTNLGFTYQDVCEALESAGIDSDDSEIVSTYTDKDSGETYGGIAYGQMIALLVYEVQELKQRVSDLEGK